MFKTNKLREWRELFYNISTNPYGGRKEHTHIGTHEHTEENQIFIAPILKPLPWTKLTHHQSWIWIRFSGIWKKLGVSARWLKIFLLMFVEETQDLYLSLTGPVPKDLSPFCFFLDKNYLPQICILKGWPWWESQKRAGRSFTISKAQEWDDSPS